MSRAPAPPHRVLLIEDSRDDAELIEIALRDGGEVECRRAWSAQTVREALAEFAPQIVLSDLNLPGFSAGEALEMVRAHDPALPFVLLTGLVPETPSTPAAADAVLSKDELHALPALVARLAGPR